MIRIMMEDNQIHSDVIAKLWQVYSKHLGHDVNKVLTSSEGSERPLPRVQRRGAVIILGMLALAKRSVVADRVDVLVKIGLGKLGQASTVSTHRSNFINYPLGRSYTCSVHMRGYSTSQWKREENQGLVVGQEYSARSR